MKLFHFSSMLIWMARWLCKPYIFKKKKRTGRRKCSSLSYVWLWDPMDCSPSGSSVHEISQAILEWVAISFSRGSSQPRDWRLHCRQILHPQSQQTSWALCVGIVFCRWLYLSLMEQVWLGNQWKLIETLKYPQGFIITPPFIQNTQPEKAPPITEINHIHSYLQTL